MGDLVAAVQPTRSRGPLPAEATIIDPSPDNDTWSGLPEIAGALEHHDVVAIVSGVSDFREAQALLEARLPGRWRLLEWGMGSADNRSRFHHLQVQTGFPHLPMFLGRSGLIGGLPELREFLESTAPSAAVSPAADRDFPVPSPDADHDAVMAPEARVDALLYGLGFAGLLPFLFLGLGAWWLLPDAQAWALAGLAAYGAVILSFLGAIHWGLYLRERHHRVLGWPAPYWAVTPSILAWFALLAPLRWGLVLLAILFPLGLAVDLQTLVRNKMPPGYLRLRVYLTSIAVVALISGSILAR